MSMCDVAMEWQSARAQRAALRHRLQVFVQWTEMPGSKIRATSILSMAWELLTVKVCAVVRLDISKVLHCCPITRTPTLAPTPPQSLVLLPPHMLLHGQVAYQILGLW